VAQTIAVGDCFDFSCGKTRGASMPPNRSMENLSSAPAGPHAKAAAKEAPQIKAAFFILSSRRLGRFLRFLGAVRTTCLAV
jgi:hypothetical protein